MREVNGELRMTVAELIAQLQKLPPDMEVSGMNSLVWWVVHEPKEKDDDTAI